VDVGQSEGQQIGKESENEGAWVENLDGRIRATTSCVTSKTPLA